MSKGKVKILLFAFACEPNKGSEPGVGWNWAIHLSKYLNVTVVTRKNNKNSIESAIRNLSNSNLSFIYYDIPILAKLKNYIPFGIQIYFLLWEYFVVKKIKNISANILQRITFVTTVSLLRIYKLKTPYIFSFCAGGEKTPISIYNTYNFFDKIKEIVRIFYNSFYLYSIITRKIYTNSELIIAVTNDSKFFLENLGVKKKIIIEPAIGLSINEIKRKKNITGKVIYAGSLIYWKNIDILIKAFHGIKKEIKFEIFGTGEKEKELKRYVVKNNLRDRVLFHSPISRDLLLMKLNEYDLALHASSHDSGSMYLLEAISMGIPVLFLDTGGPKEIFRGIDYPLKVDPSLSYNDIINSFTEKINWFYDNYNTFISDFMLVREKIIEKYDWDNKAKRMIEIYKEILNENSSNS